MGDQDFSDIYGPAVSAENKSRVLQATFDDIQHQMKLSREELQWRDEMRGISAGADALRRELQRKAASDRENKGETGDASDSKEPGNSADNDTEMKYDANGNIVPPPVVPAAPPVTIAMSDNDTRGLSIGPREALRAQDPPASSFHHIVPGAASSETEIKQIEGEYMDHPGYVGTGQPILNPGVLEHVQENVSIGGVRARLIDEIRRKVKMFQDGDEKMVQVLREDEAKAMVSDQPGLTLEQAAVAVLDAPKGTKRSRVTSHLREALAGAPGRKTHIQKIEDIMKRERYAEIRAEGERRAQRRRTIAPDDEEWEEGGALFGKQKRRKRRNNVRHPYDDRWIPDTESFLPQGAAVSGHYMKRTGTDAIPISAQLQVNTAHQFTELPVRQYTQFPNFTQEIKTTPPIPIDIDTNRAPRGIGSNRGKLQFGTYKLDYGKLMGQGVLSISHPNGRKVKGYNNQRLSKGCHHAISEMVTGGKVNPKKLAAADKVFMAKLLQQSHANVPTIGSDINVPPEQQLSLIMGEMQAGNDSPMLKKQLKKLLPNLKRMGIITPQHVADIQTRYLK